MWNRKEGGATSFGHTLKAWPRLFSICLSPPEPLNVSEEIVEFVDSDMSDNDDLIVDTNSSCSWGTS